MITDAESLAVLLPGSWLVGASNFPIWLRGDRLLPRFDYELAGTAPLTLIDRVSYLTRAGDTKVISGIDKFGPRGFTWRGRGMLKLFASHWQVIGAADDGSFVVIRFTKTRITPAGVDIITREGIDSMELRALIVAAPTDFGLTAGELASLTWLETAAP